MAEPNSRYEIKDLLVRIAVEMGISYYGSDGQGIAEIPVEAHNFDLCKRVVTDGIKKFIADAPTHGWRWMRRILAVTFTATRITGTADAGTNATHLIDLTLATTYTTTDELLNYYAYVLTGTGAGSYAKITAYNKTTGDCTVADWLDANGNAGGTDPVATDTFAITGVETVGGDIARYPLPENFGGSPDGQIQYAADTNHSSLIQWASESLIRQRRAASVITGYPTHAAIRPLEPVNSAPSAKRRFELVVDAQPIVADTVEFPYTLFFDNIDFQSGDASGGAATTLTDSTIANVHADDYFNGWTIKITGGTGKGSYAVVSDYTGATGIFTVVDWLTISGVGGGTDPAANDSYTVEPANNLHPAGFRFDWVILTACLSEAEMQSEEQTSQRWTQEYLKKALPKAYETDKRSAPRRLGNFNYKLGFVREKQYTDIVHE